MSPFRNTALSHLRPPEGFHDRFIDEVKTKTSDVEDELWGLDESEHSLQLSKHLMRSVGEGETFKICEWLPVVRQFQKLMVDR